MIMQFNEYQFKPDVAIERYDGDEDLLAELVRIFIDELPIYDEEIHRYSDLIYTTQQLEMLPKLQALCHKIRGSSFAIGLESLGNLAEAIEHHLSTHLSATDDLRMMIEQMQKGICQARTHLPNWLAERDR